MAVSAALGVALALQLDRVALAPEGLQLWLGEDFARNSSAVQANVVNERIDVSFLDDVRFAG